MYSSRRDAYPRDDYLLWITRTKYAEALASIFQRFRASSAFWLNDHRDHYPHFSMSLQHFDLKEKIGILLNFSEIVVATTIFPVGVVKSIIGQYLGVPQYVGVRDSQIELLSIIQPQQCDYSPTN